MKYYVTADIHGFLSLFQGALEESGYYEDPDEKKIIICGDLFDTGRVSATTAQFILDTMSSVPAVTFLYLKGNHDEANRAFAHSALPKNVLTFGDEWTYHSFGELTIAGIELADSNCHSLYDRLQLNKNRKNIVMLHGQTAGHSGQELVSLPDLRGKHIDYLALGHIHSYEPAFPPSVF